MYGSKYIINSARLQVPIEMHRELMNVIKFYINPPPPKKMAFVYTLFTIKPKYYNYYYHIFVSHVNIIHPQYV